MAPQAPPFNFYSHFRSILIVFIVSLLVITTVVGVGAVRALPMFWHVYACQ